MGVLFDQKYRYAFLADGADNVKNLADDQRSQTQCRLIEQQKLGFGHQRAAYGQHLLLAARSEEHTSELQSLMRISYADFCLKKNNDKHEHYKSKKQKIERKKKNK